jgi:hypothetical protein
LVVAPAPSYSTIGTVSGTNDRRAASLKAGFKRIVKNVGNGRARQLMVDRTATAPIRMMPK